MQRKNRSYGGECLIEEQIIKRISRDIKGRLGHAAVFGSLILQGVSCHLCTNWGFLSAAFGQWVVYCIV